MQKDGWHKWQNNIKAFYSKAVDVILLELSHLLDFGVLITNCVILIDLFNMKGHVKFDCVSRNIICYVRYQC